VVTSFTSMNVVAALASRVLQEPSAAIKPMAPFGPEPESPPLATRYTWSPALQLYSPVTLKLPSGPEGTVTIVRGAEPTPVLPAAYIVTLEPEIGFCPPWTTPRTVCSTDVPVAPVVPGLAPVPHPTSTPANALKQMQVDNAPKFEVEERKERRVAGPEVACMGVPQSHPPLPCGAIQLGLHECLPVYTPPTRERMSSAQRSFCQAAESGGLATIRCPPAAARAPAGCRRSP
jgi:hypothetical protein